MNAKPNFQRLAIVLLLTTGGSGWSQSAVVWDGPIITFNHAAGAGTSVYDSLTPKVWLTRGDTEGIFNVVTEGGYTHLLSPSDTEWAYGQLANYSSLSFSSWEQWNGGRPPDNMVGRPAVVHLISENIYLSLLFTAWGGSGGSGAFSYDRSTPSLVPEPSTSVLCGISGWLALAAVKRKRISPRPGRPRGIPL